MDTVREIRTVMLVDDHPIVRDGLRQMIGRDATLQVCGEAGSAEEALSLADQLRPDLITVDVFLDGINGIELTKILTDRYPGIRILILSMHDENLYAERGLQAGAAGFVMKQESSAIILDAMHKVLDGDRYVSASLRDILETVRPRRDTVSPPQDIRLRLSEREIAIFRAFGQGSDRNAVAEQLQISIKTVETHRANIRNKLDLNRATDLAEVAKAWLEGEGRETKGGGLVV
jgi:DNA-binding NarL/FixJ family response regulator